MRLIKKWLRKPNRLLVALLAIAILVSCVGTSLGKYVTEAHTADLDLTISPETVNAPDLALKNDLLVYLNGRSHNGSTWTNLVNSSKSATVNSGATWTESSLLFATEAQGAAFFDTNFGVTGSYTLETTFYLSDIPTTEGWLVTSLEAGGFGISILNDGRIRVWFGDTQGDGNGDKYAGQYTILESTKKLSANQIYTIAIVCDTVSKDLTLYVDGIVWGSAKQKGNTNLPQSDTVLAICSNATGTNVPSQGPACEIFTVRLYECALNQAAVSNNYNFDRENCTYVTSGMQQLVTPARNSAIIPHGVDTTGGAFVFDEKTDHIEFNKTVVGNTNYNNGFFSESGFTMECTFSISASGQNANNDGNCLGSSYQNGGYGLELHDDYPFIRAWIGGKYVSLQADEKVVPNKIYTITGTYSKSEGMLKLYVNGSLKKETRVSGDLTMGNNNTGQAFLIGTNPGTTFITDGVLDTSYTFTGYIYSFALYNKALSAGQISANEKYRTSAGDGELYICGTGTLTGNAADQAKNVTLQYSLNNSSWTDGNSFHVSGNGSATAYGRAVSARGAISAVTTSSLTVPQSPSRLVGPLSPVTTEIANTYDRDSEVELPEDVTTGETLAITEMPDIAELYAQAEANGPENTILYGWLVDAGFGQQFITVEDLEEALKMIYDEESDWEIFLTPLYQAVEPEPTEPEDPDETEPTDPSEPDETDPSEPEETDPSEPEETDPSEPEETDPSEPEDTDPSEPEETDPSEPEDTDPSEPEETDPSEPEETDPADTEGNDPEHANESESSTPAGSGPSADNKKKQKWLSKFW